MQKITINTAAPHPYSTSILIIYTGGTLGMVYDQDENFLKPFDFSQILEKIPELEQFAYRLTVLSPDELIDSANMRPANWVNIAKLIGEYYQDYDGFLILHGTDTMAYTASALSFLLENLSKPVILTGAQLPIGGVRSDARRNLLTAIQIAASEENFTVPEVCIFFDDVLLRGNRSKKVESSHFAAFHSENYPALAKIGIDIEYNQRAILPKPNQSFKFHKSLDECVALIKIFPGISQEVVKTTLKLDNIKGIILETYGSGNALTDEWFIDLLAESIKKGKIILNVSQCIAGRVSQGAYETSTGLAKIGVVSGADLTTEAALAKLMFLLGQGLEGKKLKEKLIEPICGEKVV